MAAISQNLEEIITQSMTKAGESIPTSTTEETTSPVETPTSKETVTESEVETEKTESDDLGLSQEDLLQARQLFVALKDPKKAPSVIRFLVDSSGLEMPETKKEVKEVKKALTEQLKEALGPELGFMAEKMGPILQTFLDEKINDVQETNEQRFSEQALEREKTATTLALGELATELFGLPEVPADFITETSKLIDSYPPKTGQTAKSYLKDMIHLAAGRLGKPIVKTNGKQIEKAIKNNTDAASRLASDGKFPFPGREISTSKTNKAFSIDEAVKLGLENTNALFQAE